MEEQRAETTRLLMALIEQRERRQKQLAQMMVNCFAVLSLSLFVCSSLRCIYLFQRDMERAREEESADFWLAQMQRLIDSKPEILIDRVS